MPRFSVIQTRFYKAMKSQFRRWIGICLLGSVVLCGVLSVPPAMAQGTQSVKSHADIKKVVYKDIDESLFNSTEGKLPPKESLQNLGIGFPEGTSVTYNAKKKALILVNTKEAHKIMHEILSVYNSNKPKEHTMEFLDDCKAISGKLNKKAKLYVFIVIGQEDVAVAKKNGFKGLALSAEDKSLYKTNLKAIDNLQKIKEAQVVLLTEDGCDVKKVNKIAKAFKINAPLLVCDPSLASRNDIRFIMGGNIIIKERSGKTVELGNSDIGGLIGGSCEYYPGVVKKWLKENAK